MASALCLAFLFITLSSKAQTVDTTGNLVNFTNQATSTTSTWQNAGTIGAGLTCWQGGDPGYCGPLPRVAAWGSGSNVINFSYGLTNLHQIVNVNNALSSAGTGLQVNGFNFSFQAKNGNGWDDGRQDYLTAYVNIYNNTNSKVLESYNYDLNRRYNWTTFSYSETFKTPYATPDVGNATYGFIGRDNNYWVGPYGPEVTAVNFSLKYSVDPCATNVLSSPSCAGYSAALAKLIPTPVAASPDPAAPPPETIAIAPPSPSQQSGAPLSPGAPPVQESQQLAQPGPAQPGGPQPGPSGPAPQQAAAQPSANNQQPKAGEVADSGGGKSSPVSLSSVLSMISSNQDKTSALEKSVVQSADAQAFTAGESAKQQAEKIAGDMQSQSMNAGGGGSSTSVQTTSAQSSFTQTQSSMVSLQGGQQSSIASNAARVQQSINSSVSSQSNILNFTGMTTQQSSYQNTTKQEVTVAIATPVVSYNLVAPTRQSVQPQVEIPMLEGIKFGVKSAVDSAMESKPFVPQMNDSSQQNDSVKRNIENNELAGNITIESIAKQPANYSQYFFMIPDVAFYAPKEIYKNQTTVDNVRALRQLSSDRLHQQMVDQQYK